MDGTHYCPSDLHNLSGNENLKSLTKRIVAAIKDFYTVMDFRSKVIEDYYNKISAYHLKRYFRLVLKFLIFFSFTMLVYSPLLKPGSPEDFFMACGIIISCFIGYWLTIDMIKTSWYLKLSILLILIVLSVITYRFDVMSTMETAYTPAVQMITIMFTVLPIKFEMSFTIALLFCAVYEVHTYARFRLAPQDLQDTRVNDDKPWDPFQIFNIFNLNDIKNKNYCFGQSILWAAIIFGGIYLHISNQLRRRASFLRLGENVKAQKQVQDAYNSQMHCISTIMPSEIKDAYWKEKRSNEHEEMWTFLRYYENVSILFADIVGFTKMSSNKTAPQVVTLLNDLFNRFDLMCAFTNCEKLGTLGDCYYCVAGCPSPRSDHAVCCIEMGLGMCRIIKAFNKDYDESVNMRVGIHTGRVNAGIIGSVRFRFDVYSNDVMISNDMESSGEPGRVHISEQTHKLVQHLYKFKKGNGLEVKHESKLGIQGMKLTEITLSTYFVAAESSLLLKNTRNIERGKKMDFHIINDKKFAQEQREHKVAEDAENDFDAMDDDVVIPETGKLDADMQFIDLLQRDPEKQVKLFGSPPLSPITLRFTDEEVEKHYSNHARDEVNPMYVDSVKLAPLMDSIASCIYLCLITFACYVFFPHEFKERLHFVIIPITLAGMNTLMLYWSTVQIFTKIKNPRILRMHRTLSHFIFRDAQALLMGTLPTCVVVSMYSTQRYVKDHLYTGAYFSVSIFALMCNLLLVSSSFWVNGISSTLMVVTFFYIYWTGPVEFRYQKPFTCPLLFQDRYNTGFGIPQLGDFVLTLFVMIMLHRENEKNLRLCFFVSREALIRHDEAEKAMVDSRQILHNIIPSYVLDIIKVRGGDIAKGNCNYARNIKNAAVIFSCISNFFSSYYREDYKGGEGALRLLNKIISMFDALLKDPKYFAVEKIKTINDCYMVAAGLDTELVAKSNDEKKHLRALMHFCFGMRETLKIFNREFIFGKDHLEMKIGYNTGPVTAGVIGTTKPMYDIWGDTVNVASRMYSTGAIHLIQLPEHSVPFIQSHFSCSYRAMVTVKGKGEMKTFLCDSIINDE